MGKPAVDGESPVTETINVCVRCVFPSRTGPVKSRVNLARPLAKPEYYLVTDSGSVP